MRWGALGVSMLGLVLTLAGAGGLGRPRRRWASACRSLAAFAQAFYVLAARHGFPDVQPIEAADIHDGPGGNRLRRHRHHYRTGLPRSPHPWHSSDALIAVLLAGLIGAAIPTLCFITGIRLLGAPRAAILATLEPVVGVALAAWLLNEQPSPLQLAGGVLILVAAVLLQVAGGGAAEHEAVAA